ncbi:MAG: hypothetical protein OEY89_05105 [Gammaproteobacteria bacterium]|nr:hypothetical protein [Gammaproteobacteria bacterium]
MKKVNQHLLLLLALAVSINISHAGQYEINTFLDIGAATQDGKGNYLQSIPDKIAFEYDSRYGINLRTELNESITGAGQLLATGRSGSFDFELEWGFVEYNMSRSWRLRVGKLNLQTFLLSDYIEVGYLYPWIRPPEEVYGFNPMRNYPGIELMHTAQLGKKTTLTSMFFVGSSKVQLSPATSFRALNGYGINFQLNMPGVTLRIGGITPEIEVNQSAFLMQDESGTMMSIPGAQVAADNRMYMATFGFSWDVSDFVGYGEWINVSSEKELQEIFPEQTGYYLTMGYKFDDFMPYVTKATAEADAFTGTVTQIGVMPMPAIAQDSIALGIRYEINEFSAFKFEYKKIDPEISSILVDLGGGAMPIAPNAGFLFGNSMMAADDDYTLISMSYDMIF